MLSKQDIIVIFAVIAISWILRLCLWPLILRRHAQKDARSALARAREAYGLISIDPSAHGGISVNSGDLVGAPNNTTFTGSEPIDSDDVPLLLHPGGGRGGGGGGGGGGVGYNNHLYTYEGDDHDNDGKDNDADEDHYDTHIGPATHGATAPAPPVPLCHICEEEKATKYCAQCTMTKLLCDGCHASSHKFVKKQGHASVPIQEHLASGPAHAPSSTLDTSDDDDDDDDDEEDHYAFGPSTPGAIAPPSSYLTAVAIAKKKKKQRRKKLSKFVAPTISLGKSMLAAKGLDVLLGIDPNTYMHVKDKVAVILKEFAKNGTDEDKENLKTLLDGTFINPEEPDAQQMTFEELMACDTMQASGLEGYHILALRLYTTSSYRSINNPMRQSPPVLPHPFGATLYYISDALSKLREVQGRDPAMRNETLVFWRGMKDLQITDDFLQTGGSEMACMSTTSSREVAEDFAWSKSPLLFKFVSNSFMSHGADISWLSVYPNEKEVLYPPLTYLRPIRITEETIATTVYKVVEVEPVFPK